MVRSFFQSKSAAPSPAEVYKADMFKVANALAVHYGLGFRNRLRRTADSPIWDADKSGMLPLISPVPVHIAVSQTRIGVDIHPKPIEVRLRSNQTVYDLVIEGEEIRQCFSDFYRIGPDGFAHVFLIGQERRAREKADIALETMRRLATRIRVAAEDGSTSLRLLRGASVSGSESGTAMARRNSEQVLG
jgi:hypothetical protein